MVPITDLNSAKMEETTIAVEELIVDQAQTKVNGTKIVAVSLITDQDCKMAATVKIVE